MIFPEGTSSRGFDERESLVSKGYAMERLVVPDDQGEVTADDLRRHWVGLIEDRINVDVRDPRQAVALAVLATDKYGRVFLGNRLFMLEALSGLTGDKWTEAKFAQNFRRLKESRGWKDGIVGRMVESFEDRHGNTYGDIMDTFVLARLDPKSGAGVGSLRMLNDRVRQLERVRRLGQLLPPADPEAWADAVRQTVELIGEKELKIDQEMNFTAEELVAVNTCLGEYVSQAGKEGRVLQHLLTDKSWGIDFSDIAISLRKRLERKFEVVGKIGDNVYLYQYCVKLALGIANNSVWGGGMGSPAERIREIMKLPQSDVFELTRWLAYRGRVEAPKWFRGRKENGANGGKTASAETLGNRIYNYAESLPRADRPIIILYTDSNLEVPAEVKLEGLGRLRASGRYAEIPTEDIERFNQVMSEIFGNPNSNDNKGRRVAIAIKGILSHDKKWLLDIPFTNDREMEHLRKIDVAQQRVGVYGQWSTRGEPQLFVLTARHKNERRTATGR